MSENNQKENIDNLLKLIQENPCVEIIPMVDTECVQGDDYGLWMAEWGKSRLDQYYCSEERIFSRYHDFDGMVDDWMDNHEYDPEYENLAYEDYVETAQKAVAAFSWKDAIIVHITPKIGE